MSQYWPCTYKATSGLTVTQTEGLPFIVTKVLNRVEAHPVLSSAAFLQCVGSGCCKTWDEQMQWRWSQSSRMCTFWASSCSPAVWEFKTAHIDILKVNCLCFWDCVRLVTVLYQRSTSNVNMWAFFTSDCGGLIPHLPTLYNMTSSMLRRQLKNLVQNYSEAEVKVRIRILCTNSQCRVLRKNIRIEMHLLLQLRTHWHLSLWTVSVVPHFTLIFISVVIFIWCKKKISSVHNENFQFPKWWHTWFHEFLFENSML